MTAFEFFWLIMALFGVALSLVRVSQQRRWNKQSGVERRYILGWGATFVCSLIILIVIIVT